MTKQLVRLGCALALCAFSIGASADEPPVRIGVALPLSGPAATYGHDMKKGSDLAAEEINARGGILNGRKVQLVYEDDKGTPQGGVAAVQKLMSVGRVKAISGGSNSSVVLAESSITRNRILQVNAGAQADAITDQGSPWMFQINNTVTANSRFFNKYLVTEIKPKTVAYMGENTEFNKTVLEQLRESLSKAGIELVNVSVYDAETNDFTSMISRIKSLNPDMLYVADAYPARAAQLWKQVRQFGGFPHEVMSPGVVTPGMIQPSEGAMEGVITGEIYMAASPGEPNQRYVKAFQSTFNALPRKGDLVMYESIHLIAAAMDKAKSDSDYAAISKTIRSNKWPSPRGELSFDEKGRATSSYFYIQQVRNGEVVQIHELNTN